MRYNSGNFIVSTRSDCTDYDPIDKWVPDDMFHIDFWVNFTIGPDHDGGDNFRVRFVTKGYN